ncbi:ABC transporter substrate-binding protein [Leifsonia sp. NPDC056665]|uniref:ABC transporter substrate-binding protein n=1 Tax=Leifsonia sp. NPDC056665 TaxID=3345901 RepID=UPI003686159E
MKRLSAALVGGVSVLALALTGCSAAASPKASSGGTLTVATSYGPNSLAPGDLSGGGEGTYYWTPVFDTLLKTQPDGTPTPGLATKWSYNKSLTQLTLTLRKGIKFSDGEVLDAAAVEANIKHTQSGSGSDVSELAAVSQVHVPDSDTVVLDLKTQDPGLLRSLGGPAGAIGSPRSLTSKDVATSPVGSGPYVLDKSRTTNDAEYVYTRRPGAYWDAASWKYDTIVLKVTTDETARVNALNSGQVNAAYILPPEAKQVTNAGNKILASPNGFSGLGIFDREGKIQPAFKDVRVRQAINYAIDRKQILQATALGYGKLSQQFFADGQLGHVDSLDKTYSYDVKKARSLMAAAGYANGFDITIPLIGSGNATTALIQEALGKINIRATYKTIAPTDIYSALFGGTYPMFLMGGGGGSWQLIKGDLMPDSIWNMLHASDPELTALIATARKAPADQQQEAFAAVNKWVVKNAWFDIMWQAESLYAVDSKTTAKTGGALDTPPLWTFAPAK